MRGGWGLLTPVMGVARLTLPLPESQTQTQTQPVPLPAGDALSVTLNGFLMSLAMQENAHSTLQKLHVTAVYVCVFFNIRNRFYVDNSTIIIGLWA